MELMLGLTTPSSTIHVPSVPRTSTTDIVRVNSLAVVTATGVTADWRSKLPVFAGPQVVLRQLEQADAASLMALLTTEEVSRFISPPPTTVEGFERFIAWTHRERTAGRYACYGIVPKGGDRAVGLFQVRALDSRFGLAEWGFALGSRYWGKGLFPEGALMTLAFAFAHIGVYRLEARAVVPNGRAQGALRKIGARQDAVLRRSFQRNGQTYDQVLWSYLADDWRRENGLWVH
jgi:ribosomal-protein-alanine N-acetyltransferase